MEKWKKWKKAKSGDVESGGGSFAESAAPSNCLDGEEQDDDILVRGSRVRSSRAHDSDDDGSSDSSVKSRASTALW